MNQEKRSVSSGVERLDTLLGGLFIGDNVVWYDDAGSLASIFCHNFIRVSREEQKPIVYVTFDRSPKNLVEKLGPLAENPNMTIVDCFTHGKGEGSRVFLKFYREKADSLPCRIIKIENPHNMEKFTKAFYELFDNIEDDVRFVFETLTGMQELWGEEKHIVDFYSHTCPRLYELNTIAYWIMEKKAHSGRAKATINHVAQVAVELSVRRGMTSLTLLKAEKRQTDNINKPYNYWTRDLDVTIETDGRTGGRLELGERLRNIRKSRGVSQTELARLVGLTPGTISQVESSQIYPSLPALIKIAEVLSVEIKSFFENSREVNRQIVFTPNNAVSVRLDNVSSEKAKAMLLASFDPETRIEPYMIEIQPGAQLLSHFFSHKGEEMGYMLSGTLEIRLAKGKSTAQKGDLIYLTRETPLEWKNPGTDTAQILWLKVK